MARRKKRVKELQATLNASADLVDTVRSEVERQKAWRREHGFDDETLERIKQRFDQQQNQSKGDDHHTRATPSKLSHQPPLDNDFYVGDSSSSKPDTSSVSTESVTIKVNRATTRFDKI